MMMTCNSSATKIRRRQSPDSCADDVCLAKNLLRSVGSDDDDDGAATGRLRPPTVRDLQPPDCPCTSSAWKFSGMVAVPSRDCPFCWAQLSVVDDCENCSVDANQSSHRWSTPGILITSSAESPTFPTPACIHGGNYQDDDSSSVAKRRCSSLTTDSDTVPPALPCRSVPDIARNSLRGRRSPTPPAPSSTTDRWLSAGVASLPRMTTVPRADILSACLHCPSN